MTQDAEATMLERYQSILADSDGSSEIVEQLNDQQIADLEALCE